MADIKSFVARLFGSRAQPDPAAVDPDAVQPGVWDDGLELSLGQIAADIETKASGRVQVITLAHLRHSLGEHWEKYRPNILLIAETTIGRKLGKGNTFIPQDEDSWLLLMPSLSESEAEARADEIAAVLGEKLVGERFTEKEPPMPQSAKVDLTGAMRRDGTLDLEALRQSVKKARLGLAARDAKRAVAILNRSPAEEQPLDAVSAPAHSRFSELTLTYRPAWSADTESIDTFNLRAFDHSAEIVYGRPDVAASEVLNDPTVADIAKAALGAFALMVKSGLRAKFVLPVPYSITRRRVGVALFRAIAALPQRDRLMHLRVEFTGLPPGVAPDHLVELRETFRGRVREVAFLMDLFDYRDSVFALENVVIGAEAIREKFSDDQAFRAAMVTFRRKAGSRRAYIMGLRTRDMVGAAVSSGFDEVSGIGLVDDTQHLPLHTVVKHRHDLIRGIQPQEMPRAE